MGFLALLPYVALLLPAQSDELRALEGEWIFVDDRTEGRPLEQFNPPMSSKFSIRVEADAVILASGHGSGHKDVRIALDGTTIEVPTANAGAFACYRGSWREGAFTYEVDFVREPGGTPGSLIRREFRATADGLVVRSNLELTPGVGSVGLYRKPLDIAMPTPAKATINDLSWMAGTWSGTRSSGATIEERWSPPKGGAMLAVARTVNATGRMSAFEYLRIVERDGGLVYVAQPGGSPPTEFVMTELSAMRAVFDNPRHDYPKRIVYELTADGGLTATIGFLKGGAPRRLEFKRTGD